MNDRIAALVIFLVTYVLFVLLPTRRMLAALGAGAALLLLRVVAPVEAFFSINWNVIGIFVGNLMVADVLVESHVPAYLA